ncbi:MAG: sialidase family protein [Eubacteriales bacterium]|jgi:hypothetical protein|nr:sialidase family protein [Eubacteriales bacterium]
MDCRNIDNGNVIIKSNSYVDQPYIIDTGDAWLACVTAGSGHEGQPGQHVITLRSRDRGRTWGEKAQVESPDMPESSYAVMHRCAGGRIYCFYNYNAGNLRAVRADADVYPGGQCPRVDSQGHFVYKYSDDGGRSWSERRYKIEMRLFDVDLGNAYGGEILFFWNVGKPFVSAEGLLVPVTKIGGFGRGFMYDTEGALLLCRNIETESDPDKLLWETLPDGPHGIKAPRGITRVSEEHSYVTLSDGGIFCVFRTTSSQPWCAYSGDGGHSFGAPRPLTYFDGSPVYNPRAANFIWKCKNGRYLYWHHNHNGNDFTGRNPVWLSGAVEYMTGEGSCLKFSYPEVLLYSHDREARFSYPDMIEYDGDCYFTESDKTCARIHRADSEILARLWRFG